MKAPYWQQISAVLLLLLPGCQHQSTPLAEAQRTRVVDEVTSRQAELIQAVANLDATAMSELQSEDEFLAYVAIDDYLDRPAFADSLSAWFRMRETQGFDPITMKVYPLTAELAIGDIEAAGAITFTDGTKSAGRNMISLVWQKEPTGWYIIHYAESWRYSAVD